MIPRLRKSLHPSPHDVSSQFVAAAATGRRDVAQELLSSGSVSVDTRSPASSETPLLAAVSVGDAQMVELLIGTWHASPDLALPDGTTPLFLAAQSGLLHIVELLLLRARADPTLARTADGWTPLHAAAAAGRAEVCGSLLRSGADPNARATDGRTPLLAAAYAGQLASVAALLRPGCGVDANSVDAEGSSLLHIAAERGSKHMAELAFNARGLPRPPNTRLLRDSDGATALIVACALGHTDVAEVIMSRGGADPNAADLRGASPLWHACSGGHHATAAMLLRAGADPNAECGDVSCLLVAAMHGSVRVVEELLRCNADNASPKPLIAASAAGHLGVVDVLLQAG